MNLFPHTLMRIGGIPFEKLDALCIDTLLLEEIYQNIETLSSDIELEKQFNEALVCIRENIKNLSKETALRNGLVLSAPALLDRILSYQKKEIADFRKKEKQTERTIVQYLTRIATKTSPFSTFNQISLADIKEQNTLIENSELTSNQSFVRINNYILKTFKDSIVQDRTLIQNLEITVNSTLTKLENGFEFLVNDNNIEAFQTIENHPVVELILEKIAINKVISFSFLIKKLLVDVEADIQDLENFVLELHQIGLLVFNINISNLDANWELKCLDLLDRLPKSPLSENWIKLLSELQEAKQKYPQLHASERSILLKKALIRFDNAIEKVNKTTINTKEAVFKKQFDNQLAFNEMNLLYEDYAAQSSTNLSKNAIEQLIFNINAFVNTLQSLSENEELKELIHFYKNHYHTTSVELLTFYKDFSKWKRSASSNSHFENNFNERRLKKWRNQLKQTIFIENNIVNIEITQLQNSDLDFKNKNSHASHSAFVQLYKNPKNEKQFSCFLNTAMPGYGKYFSRFLHLFPKNITNALQKRNNHSTQLFAEINDASFFNANIHPPLMPFEIKLLDENAQVSEQEQILLKEIEITFINDELKLIHTKTRKEIIPFDLGFLALAGRSELFKLLSYFSKARFSPIYEVINVVNSLVKDKNEISIFPRITIENQITIQRKTWIISKNSIPKPQQKHETEWVLYKRVLSWVKKNDLPLEGFYTINSKELAKNKAAIRNTDAYKPQYINFKNPILVQLFIRSCKKIEISLKFEEMLPSSKTLLDWNNENYVSEFLFQWKN